MPELGAEAFQTQALGNTMLGDQTLVQLLSLASYLEEPLSWAVVVKGQGPHSAEWGASVTSNAILITLFKNF